MSPGSLNRQLLLDLDPPLGPTLANFVPGRNASVLFLLQGLARGERSERQLHLWGGPGSGKTHLLRALGETEGACYQSSKVPSALEFNPAVRLWCIDDVDAAPPEVQMALFGLINAVRDSPATALVTAANAPPLYLRLREDLRTRLGWGPVFQIEPLDDAERRAALSQRAKERGLVLSEDVLNYLLTHFNRDMPSLVAILDALDRYGLEKQRALTPSLVREWLASRTSIHPAR